MKKYSVDFTGYARSLLRNHVRFLSNVSPNAARKLYNGAYAKIRTLYDNPFQYPVWQVPYKLPHEYRRIVVDRRYFIIFFIDGNNVFVDYIFSASMENSKFIDSPSE